MMGKSDGVSKDELLEHVRRLVVQRVGPLSQELAELLEESVKRCYGELDLGLPGGLVAGEWRHAALLQASAPGDVASQHLNRRLRTALIKEPELLARVLAAFEQHACAGARLPQAELTRALEQVGVESASLSDLDNQVSLGYFEFVSYVVGIRPSTVELAMYDLSNGLVQWIPAAALGGQKFEGVWHTGVRAFDTEYWYGGGIFPSRIGDGEIPFGAPKRVQLLGSTWRSKEELMEFIQNDLLPSYNRHSYDVLTRNCNHFSNEVVQFLLNGKRLDQAILMQPEWARNAVLVKMLRPILNRELGCFGQSGKRVASAHAFVDDLTAEWRSRVRPGDLVLHRERFIDHPRVARVSQLMRAGGQACCELLAFGPGGPDPSSPCSGSPQSSPQGGLRGALLEPLRWSLVRYHRVPLHDIWPCLSRASLGATVLLASLAAQDANAARVLRRLPSRHSAHCLRHHELQPFTRQWLMQAPPCSICEVTLGTRDGLYCKDCRFHVCNRCLNCGQQFADGGVFSDILTRDLARDLLTHPGWRRFWARALFHRTRYAGEALDREEMRRLSDRLCSDLGRAKLTSAELGRLLADFGSPLGDGQVELDQDALEKFFTEIVRETCALHINL